MTAPVTLSGEFFRTDVGRQTKRALGKIVTGVAIVGKSELMAELHPGHGVQSGTFRRGIRRKAKGLNARVFASNNMLAAWLQGGSTLIRRRTRFRGYQIFDRAAERTDASAGEAARKGVAELMRVLGGS